MHTLCRADDIPEGQCRQFALGGINVFIVHYQGRFYGYQNRCPHLGIELQWQENQFLDYDGELIQCATHNALFVIETGECVAGPCRGASLTPIAISEQAGELRVTPPATEF